MLSGPICAMVWEGRDAVKTGRVLLGATNPLASAPGTIRGDFSIDVGRNVYVIPESIFLSPSACCVGSELCWFRCYQDYTPAFMHRVSHKATPVSTF